MNMLTHDTAMLITTQAIGMDELDLAHSVQSFGFTLNKNKNKQI